MIKTHKAINQYKEIQIAFYLLVPRPLLLTNFSSRLFSLRIRQRLLESCHKHIELPQLQTNFNYPPKKLNPTFLHQPPAKTTFHFFLQITQKILNTNTNFFLSFKLYCPFPSLPEIFSCLNRYLNHLLTVHYFQSSPFFCHPINFYPTGKQRIFSTMKTIADIRIYKQTNFHYFRFLSPRSVHQSKVSSYRNHS